MSPKKHFFVERKHGIKNYFAVVEVVIIDICVNAKIKVKIQKNILYSLRELARDPLRKASLKLRRKIIRRLRWPLEPFHKDTEENNNTSSQWKSKENSQQLKAYSV